jgi:hypothetical protein
MDRSTDGHRGIGVVGIGQFPFLPTDGRRPLHQSFVRVARPVTPHGRRTHLNEACNDILRDVLSGAGAVEFILTQLVEGQQSDDEPIGWVRAERRSSRPSGSDRSRRGLVQPIEDGLGVEE